MGLFFPVFPREEWQSAKIRAWPKAARRVPRRRLSTPSPVRIGTTSKHLQCSRCAMLATDGLKTRVYEVSLADLQNEPDAERSYKKFKLVCEDVQGKNCLTQFYGMNLTTDKLRSMVKKWQTLIEAHVDAKTTDGYLLRVFCIGFTQKQSGSTKKHCYAQSQQIRQIRKKMIDIISLEISSADLKDVVNKLIPDSMSMDITKACQGIYPLHDVHVRKVKVLKRPRFDLNKLMELHGEGSGKATTTTTDPTTGEVVERPEGYEPPVQEAV